ncbi:helix-turn-helix domain-containing protein [Actinokineospora spheciospongiae]|uniref:helix-turn-helix domain-containing protein n=1 Tax=Actinokineospora spheciospongiae TaxID=909613 RepID=UPI000D918E6F|nr:helix-turn-helix domain-containing protein [Actinokineospora spheciospongiae]PWW60249.1 helix-turn-helix protein [Actinokineospora spheciospongiae]
MRGDALTVEDRDGILRCIREKLSGRAIAARLGRDASVISREIARNGGRANYRVHAAQERFEALKSWPKQRKLESDRRLHDLFAEKLLDDLSPQQVSGRLLAEFPMTGDCV